MSKVITPTIGRKVWYWPVNESGVTQLSAEQALDATVIYVASNTSVNLLVIDHAGNLHVRVGAYLHPGDVGTRPASSCATWMPYQQAQAAKAEPEPEKQSLHPDGVQESQTAAA